MICPARFITSPCEFLISYPFLLPSDSIQSFYIIASVRNGLCPPLRVFWLVEAAHRRPISHEPADVGLCCKMHYMLCRCRVPGFCAQLSLTISNSPIAGSIDGGLKE